MSNNKEIIGYAAFIILALFLSCVYRPTGLVIAPVIFFAFYLRMVKNKIHWNIFFFFFVVFALVLIILHSVIIKDVVFWPFEFGKNYLQDTVVVAYREGEVVNNRLNTYHQSPVALMDYIFITLDKFVHYFYFSDNMFKLYHKIINYIFFPPLYALFILGIMVISKKEGLPNTRSLIALAIIVIIGFSLFHALTGVDHDWRFRLPIFPYLIFVAGIGLDFLLRSLSRR
jgi:hypothetical protein